MEKFEILCVTMHQKDFSKINEMNIHSNVVFANQCDFVSYDEIDFDGGKARMVSTNTKGVGANRNIALLYASADICLLADDDVIYRDDVEEVVLSEFAAHPDADVFIFHLESEDSLRKQTHYSRTRKCGRFERMPWGGCRIAFRLHSVRKANLWFTTLFGGGCIFPSGEDSMWLTEAKRKGLTFYVSEKTIGSVSFEESSWFSGMDEKYYYGRGALYAALYKHTFWFRGIYIVLRTKKSTKLTFLQAMRMIARGREGYRKIKGF